MVGLLSRHKGKSEKREFAIAVDTLSSWAGAEPMEVWWQRGSHAGKLRPVPPGHDGDLHINQTIKLEATLFKDAKTGAYAAKPMTFFIRPANAKSKPKAGSEPQGTIDLADCAASDGHIVAIPIAEPGQGRGSDTLEKATTESGGASSVAASLTPRSEHSGIAALGTSSIGPSESTTPRMSNLQPRPEAPFASIPEPHQLPSAPEPSEPSLYARAWRPSQEAQPARALSERSLGSAMSSASSGAALAAAAAAMGPVDSMPRSPAPVESAGPARRLDQVPSPRASPRDFLATHQGAREASNAATPSAAVPAIPGFSAGSPAAEAPPPLAVAAAIPGLASMSPDPASESRDPAASPVQLSKLSSASSAASELPAQSSQSSEGAQVQPSASASSSPRVTVAPPTNGVSALGGLKDRPTSREDASTDAPSPKSLEDAPLPLVSTPSALTRPSPFSSGHDLPQLEPTPARIPGFGEAVASATADSPEEAARGHVTLDASPAPAEAGSPAWPAGQTGKAAAKPEAVAGAVAALGEMLAPRGRRFGRAKEGHRRWAWQQEQPAAAETPVKQPAKTAGGPSPGSQGRTSSLAGSPREAPPSSRSSASRSPHVAPTGSATVVSSPGPAAGAAAAIDLACAAALESAVYLVPSSRGIQPGLTIPSWYKPARRLARTLCTLHAPRDLGFAWEVRRALENAIVAAKRDLEMLVLWVSNIRQLLWMLADASGKPMASEDEDGPLHLWAGLLPALHELQALAERSIVQHLWTRHVLPEARRASLQKDPRRMWDASPTAAGAPGETPAIGHWCTGLEAALDALNSLSYPPWSRTQSLAMHASIMPSLLRKLDAVLVESLVADEVRPVVSRKDCLALSEVRDHDLTPELLLLSQESFHLPASSLGIMLKLAASTLCEWAAENALVPLLAASDLLPMLCSAANLLMVPEEVLHDSAVIQELSSGLSADLVASLLNRFSNGPPVGLESRPASVPASGMDGVPFAGLNCESMLQKGLVEPIGLEMDVESDHELEELEAGRPALPEGAGALSQRFTLLRRMWAGELAP